MNRQGITIAFPAPAQDFALIYSRRVADTARGRREEEHAAVEGKTNEWEAWKGGKRREGMEPRGE